jgi:hypothetical protein
MSKELDVGVNYLNKTTININKIDFSEVIKIKSGTIQTSIKILTGNGYNVSKNKVTINVSKLNYIIGASGMYATYCGTDNDSNFMFKLLQNTTIIDNKNNIGIIVPMNTKILVSQDSSDKYKFKKINMLINDNNVTSNELQSTINKVVNKTYSTVTSIGNPENVMPSPGESSGGENKKYKHRRIHMKTRVKTHVLLKKHNNSKRRKTRKTRKTRKN